MFAGLLANWTVTGGGAELPTVNEVTIVLSSGLESVWLELSSLITLMSCEETWVGVAMNENAGAWPCCKAPVNWPVTVVLESALVVMVQVPPTKVQEPLTGEIPGGKLLVTVTCVAGPGPLLSRLNENDKLLPT